jgi:hypothetical protein
MTSVAAHMQLSSWACQDVVCHWGGEPSNKGLAVMGRLDPAVPVALLLGPPGIQNGWKTLGWSCIPIPVELAASHLIHSLELGTRRGVQREEVVLYISPLEDLSGGLGSDTLTTGNRGGR